MNANQVVSDVRQLLRKHFGWDEFLEGQAEVVQRLLEGRSVAAVFPTGGGKSLCYQLPALVLDGVTVVVSPLIALMKDQIDALAERGISAVRLDSSLTSEQYRTAMQSIRDGSTRLLYAAPERFFNERFRASLSRLSISLFAVDEAHCISQWGHNFRPDYLKLASLAKTFSAQRVLALTATATPTVLADIRRAFRIEECDAVCTTFHRANLHLRTRVIERDVQISTLVRAIKSRDPGATLVYVTLQKTAIEVAERCVQSGLPARAYHAGMDAEPRAEVQEWFMRESQPIVVATIAFGMGIDKSNIRYVYHFNPPKSLENYAQEIGRAGRDGETSLCEMLLVSEDRIPLENFCHGDTPDREAITTFIRTIADQGDEFFVKQSQLGDLSDIKLLVVRTIMTYLELDGYLEGIAPRYESYSFKPSVASEVIVNSFEGQRREFVQQLLGCAKKRKTWFGLDIQQAMNKTHSPRERIVQAMDYFAEKGWLEVRASDLVHGYRKLRPMVAVDDLAGKYSDQLEARESDQLQRIDQVYELAMASACQSAVLADHFGQPLDASCGTCSACRGEGPFTMKNAEHPQLAPEIVAELETLASEHSAALSSPRAAARLLCGISSPALTRGRLTRHELFGSCDHIPFVKVMEQISSLSFSLTKPNF